MRKTSTGSTSFLVTFPSSLCLINTLFYEEVIPNCIHLIKVQDVTVVGKLI